MKPLIVQYCIIVLLVGCEERGRNDPTPKTFTKESVQQARTWITLVLDGLAAVCARASTTFHDKFAPQLRQSMAVGTVQCVSFFDWE